MANLNLDLGTLPPDHAKASFGVCADGHQEWKDIFTQPSKKLKVIAGPVAYDSRAGSNPQMLL